MFENLRPTLLTNSTESMIIDRAGSIGGVGTVVTRLAENPSPDLAVSTQLLDHPWALPDGEVALTVSMGRPLSAAEFPSLGAVVGEIERLAAGLTCSDA